MATTTIPEAVAFLRAAYPRQDFPDDTVRVYVSMLADMPASEVADAIERLTKRSTWLPSVAEIRVEVATAMVGLPTPEQAWALVTRRETLHAAPEVRAALDAVGGPVALMFSERPEFVRRAFLEEYRARRDMAIGECNGSVAPTRAALTGPERAFGTLAERGQQIEESTSIVARPVWARWLRRVEASCDARIHPTMVVLVAPTPEEKHDAILVLETGGYEGGDWSQVADALHSEAQRILDDASAS